MGGRLDLIGRGWGRRIELRTLVFYVRQLSQGLETRMILSLECSLTTDYSLVERRKKRWKGTVSVSVRVGVGVTS